MGEARDDDGAVQVLGRLSEPQVAEVGGLLREVTEVDGVAPLSEHVWLHLRQGGDTDSRHVLVHAEGSLAGYAHLDVTDPVTGANAELAVHPSARGHGVGDRLVTRLLAEARQVVPDRPVRLWAHGEQTGAGRLALRHGFTRERVLLQLRRSLLAPLPPVLLPDDVRVRTFQPGVDEAAWVRVNNRAFAAHPEQGGWTEQEIRLREAEPWFDPAGFFLAERDDTLVGFHWTKVHEGGHEPVGEVYVVGVDPDAQGSGLGRALTLVGLWHLRRRGLREAMLYVDEDNAAAVAVYDGLGFHRWDADVRYRHD